MKTWLRQHIFAISQVFSQLRHAPGNFLFNTLVLAMTLSLPFLGITLLDNVQSITRQLAVEPEISIFLTQDATRDQSLALNDAIRKIMQSDGKKIEMEFVPREKALDILKKSTGINNITATLGSNPLPDAYVIRMAGSDDNPNIAAHVEAVAAQLQKLPHVQKVQIDSDWIKRLAAILSVMRMALLFLGITLGVVVVAVIFNTIRLQVITRIDEITLSRLVGASRSFIRRPFYYMGILLGLSAGVVALCIVNLSLYPFNTAIENLAQLYSSQVQLSALDPLLSGILLLISAVLGWIGAILSVNRQLTRIS